MQSFYHLIALVTGRHNSIGNIGLEKVLVREKIPSLHVILIRNMQSMIAIHVFIKSVCPSTNLFLQDFHPQCAKYKKDI